MTGNDVIEEVQRLLLSNQREEMNKLTSNVAANATSLTLTYDLGSIRAGSLIDIDLETYRVWSVAAQIATVEPAMNGTTSTTHSAGALVYVNPRLSRAAIFKALNDEIRALSSPAHGLFQMKVLEKTFNGVVTNYDTAADVIDIYEVRQSDPGPEMAWRRMENWQWKPTSETDDFASGNAIQISGGLPGRPFRVLYKAPFTALSAPTQDLATTAGIAVEMQDILSLGVLLRLGPVREIKRNFTEAQGDSRRAEEVGGGLVVNSFGAVRQLRADRIQAEAARLAQKYPVYHR